MSGASYCGQRHTPSPCGCPAGQHLDLVADAVVGQLHLGAARIEGLHDAIQRIVAVLGRAADGVVDELAAVGRIVDEARLIVQRIGERQQVAVGIVIVGVDVPAGSVTWVIR